jgi:hypothetical protein
MAMLRKFKGGFQPGTRRSRPWGFGGRPPKNSQQEQITFSGVLFGFFWWKNEENSLMVDGNEWCMYACRRRVVNEISGRSMDLILS